MNLHDEMSRSLGEHPHAEPDVARLTAGARRDGRRRVRRRRTAIGVVAVAVVVIGGLGAGAATQLAGEDSREAVVATDPTASPTSPAPTAPTTPTASSTPSVPPSASTGEGTEPVGATTGRSAVAGLIQALKISPDRVYSDFVGSDPDPDFSAQLSYADDAGTTEVRVEVRYRAPGPSCTGDETSCTAAEVSGIGGALACEGGDPGCPREGAPFGQVVRSETALGGPVVRRTVDYLREDGVRIVVTAVNGVPSGAGYEATRDELGLGYQDLDYVVGQDWWDATMPIALIRDGQALEPYRSE